MRGSLDFNEKRNHQGEPMGGYDMEIQYKVLELKSVV
jgi:hypothetical protein